MGFRAGSTMVALGFGREQTFFDLQQFGPFRRDWTSFFSYVGFFEVFISAIASKVHYGREFTLVVSWLYHRIYWAAFLARRMHLRMRRRIDLLLCIH
ncbi:hypothetical protein F5884DRAFT_108088 [Xylogone sp. PMI_703]|nr:hypothetical protein F5884DRAFT_108088 [Xylogone sp. PMI_703]